MAEKIEIDVIANDLATAAIDLIKLKLAEIGGTFGTVGTVGIAAGAAIVGGLTTAAAAAQSYDQQIYEMMLRTGGTAEETSRLVKTLEDIGIEYGTVSTAMKFAVKNGIEPNIESLAKLSDKYLALAPGVERGQFLLDKFGRSGMDMARAMDLGGAAILRMSGGIESGLILTQQNINASEQWRMNLDKLRDTWDSLVIAMGNKVLPVINDTITGWENISKAEDWHNQIMTESIGIIDQAQNGQHIYTNEVLASAAAQANLNLSIKNGTSDIKTLTSSGSAEFWQKNADALAQNSLTEEEEKKAADALATAQKSLLTNSMQLTKNQATYNSQMDKLVAARDAENAAIANSIKLYGTSNKVATEHKAKLAEVESQIKSLEQSQEEQTNAWVLGMMQQQGASIDLQMAYAQATGQMTSQSANVVSQIAALNTKFNAGGMSVSYYKDQIKLLMASLQGINGRTFTATFMLNMNGAAQTFIQGGFGGGPKPQGNGAVQSLAEGGIATGSQGGYPALLHGSEAVIPLSGGRSVPVEMKGGKGSGGNVTVNLSYAPAFSTMDKNEMQNMLLPFIIQGIRQANQR